MKLSFDHVHIICDDVGEMKDYFINTFDATLEFLDENFHGAPNAIVRVGEAKLFTVFERSETNRKYWSK